MAYEHDVFLSYTTASSNGAWVNEHFAPLLRDRLDNSMARTPKVFVFEDQEDGTAWPENLAVSLKKSRLMVAVLSPPYFRSRWCVAEWFSMVERQQRLGMGTEEDPRVLIHPVVYADGEHFPQDARRIFSRDFSAWNFPYRHFNETPAYMEFFKAVEKLAATIADRLEESPPWEDWPVVRPDPAGVETPRLQRLI